MARNPSSGSPFDPGRRRILTGMAAAGLVGCGSSSSSNSSSTGSSGLPSPSDSGIDYIVVVMMENRSFDHILGWVPGANGMQAGLSYLDTNNASQSTFPMVGSSYGYQGCGFSDPDHSYTGGHTEYNYGAMDGFLQNQPAGDVFPIGYYTRDDVPFYSACADNWTIFDRYHSGILAPTFPNRFYMHAGQTDRITNSLATSSLPTIWDSLIAAQVSCRYYYADTNYLSLWGSKYKSIISKIAQFVTDFSQGGTPPSVCYVEPFMGGLFGLTETLGTSWDDHAYADIRNGQCFLNYIYNIVRTSPVWDRTLLIINYDEWGGFFDHVKPPTEPVSPAESALGNDGVLGVRVPCIAIGPRARRGYVESAQYDPNSILNMIAWRFGVTAPGIRASTSGNFANALDFSSSTPDTSAPEFDVSYNGETGPFPTQSPFTVPSLLTTKAFGQICKSASSSTAEARRQLQQHYAEVRALHTLSKHHDLEA